MDFRPSLLIALIAASLLAGCASGSSSTAQEAEEVARRHATARPENLLAALTTEARNGFDGYGSDDDAGDGRAASWYFAYGTGGLPAIVRVRGNDARTVASIPGPLGRLELPTEPLGALTLDSDVALRTARGDAGFAAILAADGALVHEAAGTIEGTRIWFLVAHAAGRSAFATVDADSNQLIGVTVKEDTTPEQLFPDSGHHAAGPMHLAENVTLTPTAPVKDYSFSAKQGVTFELQVRKDSPLDSLEWSVVDEAGETMESGTLAELMETSDYGSFELDLDPGLYLLRLRLATPEPNVPPQGFLAVDLAIIPR